MSGIGIFGTDGDKPPSGCRACGIGQRFHFGRWDGRRWHLYEPPTDEQIKQRMLDRRAAALRRSDPATLED